MEKLINISKKKLLALPNRDWNRITEYTSLILIPSKTLHDSGYPHITVVGVIWMKPVEIAAASCDCINISPRQFSFHLDILPKSGLTHLIASRNTFRVGNDLSSLSVTEGGPLPDYVDPR